MFGIALFFGCYSIYFILHTISLDTPILSWLKITSEQIKYITLFTVCVVIIFELIDSSLKKYRVQNFLFLKFIQSKSVKILKILWWIFYVLILFPLVIVTVLHLLGFMHGSFDNVGEMTSYITLFLLSGHYAPRVLERTNDDLKIIQEIIHNDGLISIQNRAENHKFISEILDNIEPESTIYVTSFEEPNNPMNSQEDHVYYYEADFMKKWFETVKEKQLIINHIVLINSDQDISDLQKRLQIVKDIKSYSLGYILASPLTVFVDFLIVKGKFAIIDFSDNNLMRNMDVFSVYINGGQGVIKFENIFTNILAAEAKYIKTFEGVNSNNINELQEEAEKISRSRFSSSILKKAYSFINKV
ncbi:MAG: hypothetical protein WA057_06005 [Candidatus Magasanikiibacteriota bacterium]